MWFDTDVISAATRRFPNWLGLRRGSSAEPTRPPSSRWPTVHPLEETAPAKSDGSDGKHLNPEGHTNSEWRMGWTDGRGAQSTDAYLRVLHARSGFEQLERSEELRRAAVDAEAKMRIARARLDELNVDVEHCESEFDERSRERRQNLSAYAGGLGWFYIVTGVFLLAADVPLSLLVSRALGLKGGDEDGGLSIRNLADVVANPVAFWEPISVAIGLAALGIVFKMAADYFNHAHDRAKGTLRRGLGVAVFAVVIVLLIVTFVYVGRIRGMTHAVDLKTSPPDMVAAWRSQIPPTGMVVFTLMALSFAVAGAVCFSTGANRTMNARRFRMLGRERGRLRERRQAALTDFEMFKAKAEALRAQLSTAVDASALTVELRTSLYLHGYARGLAVPDTALDAASLFERARKYRDRLIATAVQRENILRERWRDLGGVGAPENAHDGPPANA